MRETFETIGPPPPGGVAPGHVSHSFWPLTHNRLGSPPQLKEYAASWIGSTQPVSTMATFCSFTTDDVLPAKQVDAASAVQVEVQPASGSDLSGLQHSP